MNAAITGDFKLMKKIAKLMQHEQSILNSICDPRSKDSLLHLASKNGHAQMAEWLIRKHGSNVNQINIDGQTPLHLACERGNKQIIERLLLARALPNMQDGVRGNTPLHILAITDF